MAFSLLLLISTNNTNQGLPSSFLAMNSFMPLEHKDGEPHVAPSHRLANYIIVIFLYFFLLRRMQVVVIILLLPSVFSQLISHDYCILGAGPGGLQIAKFLEEAERNYIVFERSQGPGSFFQNFPRHRKLISINKRFTGRMNKEFNLRHDWNSLLSRDERLRFFHYSHDFFPHADDLVRYLQNFSSGLNVHYSKEIKKVKIKSNPEAWHGHHFLLEDQTEQEYKCK